MRNRRIFGWAAALSLIMIGGLWAQDLKFDGYINSGLGFAADDIEGSRAYFKAFGVDGESNGYRFRLNGSYTNEEKTAGARLRLQSQRNLTIPVRVSGTDINDDPLTIPNATTTYGYFSLAYAYGWVSFLNNMFTLTGGIVDDSTWQTADWWFNDDTGEGLGLLLKAAPIDGLNLGIGVYTISQQSGGSNNILTFGGNLPNFGNIMPNTDQIKYNFNASYTMPDTFRFGISFRPQNTAAWVSASPDDNYAYSGNYECCELIAELRVLAVKNLTAVVAGVFDYLDDFSKKGNIILSETFGYKADSLNLGLNAVQFLYNRTDASDNKIDYNPGILLNPWVSYTFDKIIPRLDLVYFMGGRSKMSSGANQWERRGFVNVAAKTDDKKDLSVFSIRPSIKLNIDSKTFVEIGDMINFDTANYDAYESKAGGSKDTDSRLTNVFYIDIKWSF